jgi:hypothetical protein
MSPIPKNALAPKRLSKYDNHQTLDSSEAQVLGTIGAHRVPECFLVWKDFAAMAESCRRPV